MGELHRMYDEVPPPSPVVLAEGRARLTDLARDGGRRNPRPRRTRGLLAVGLAGVVTAAGAVAIAVQGSDGGGAREFRPVSAHEVLTRAAAVARLEPELHPRPDQYLYVRSVVAWGPGRTAPNKPRGQQTRERWVSVDGSRTGLLRAPCRRQPAKSCDTPIAVEDRSAPLPRPGSHLWLVRQLPGLLKRWKPQLDAPAPAATPGRDRPFGTWSWYGMSDFVQGYLPPGLRAQVFEFLSGVPRVKVDEHATDALGRPAIALTQNSGGARLELLFDRATYRYLGSRFLDLTPRPNGGDWTDEAESGAGEVKTTILQVKVADRLPSRS
ncbi:CU044_5270 family protein [Actinomadura atramentaria]|uniref:CU044_5270 family protein n=1 Tax=Actinomadura atramentaria TaxID=1990 RepID=UPI0003673B69|nr:CU044_5270 family protein [Actinomadura atramentaria]